MTSDFAIHARRAVLAFLVVFAGASPLQATHRSPDPLEICVRNLAQVDGAKRQWAVDHKQPQSAVPEWTELTVYARDIKDSGPVCRSGGAYKRSSAGELAECSFHGSYSEAKARLLVPRVQVSILVARAIR